MKPPTNWIKYPLQVTKEEFEFLSDAEKEIFQCLWIIEKFLSGLEKK